MLSPVPELVLASSSPRRAELLTRLGVRFRVRAAHLDESSDQTDPARLVVELALRKARAVRALEPDGSALVLGADTVVVLDGAILGKPRDLSDNVAGLERLSGRTHQVFTGLALLGPHGERVEFERTDVRFRTLSRDELRGYASSGEGLDKAGGYGIQERGMALIEGISGDYFNVVGLPVVKLVLLARSLNLELLPWAAQAC